MDGRTIVKDHHELNYHHVNVDEWRDDTPHAATLLCWCEPHTIPMGADLAGRSITLYYHGSPGDDLPPDPTPLIEVVQTTSFITVCPSMEELDHYLTGEK